MLLNLILRNPHPLQILQHILHLRIIQIDPRSTRRPTPIRRPLRWRTRRLSMNLHPSRRNNTLRRTLLPSRSVPMPTMQQIPQPKPTMTLPTTSPTTTANLLILLPLPIRRLLRPARKRPRPRILMRILLPLIHLLLKLLRLLFIRKAQARHTVLQLKTMEEGPVLVVLESIVDFLVPDDAAV